eukprot:206602_1
MDIFLRTDTGNGHIYVERNSTVGDLKLQIQEKKGIPVEQQLLTLWLMGKQLDRDNIYLSDYNIHNGSTIHLSTNIVKTNPSKITIKMIDQTEITYTINVTPNDTIQKVKQSIFEKTAIPVDHQILFLNGITLFNQQTLSASFIPDDAMLDLHLRFKQINISFVLLNNEKFELSINQSKTIKDLKCLIQQKYGIPQQHQIYNHAKMNELSDEPLTYLCDKQHINLTFPICETYQNDINSYINVAENMAKELNRKFVSERGCLDTLLAETKTIITKASSLNILRNIKAKMLPKLDFGGHKFLKSFKLEMGKLKDDSVLFHNLKQVIKCVEMNNCLKEKLCLLKDKMNKIVKTNHIVINKDETKCDEYEDVKQRMKSLQKFTNKNYYKILCDFIADKNVETLNDKIVEMEKLYHKHLQEMQHQEEFKRMLIEKMKQFESNFNLWNTEMSIEWILLIENGYFDYKQYDMFIKKIKEIGINGKQLKDLNNELLLNMINLKDKQHQYVIRKHINRIIQQYENENDQSMCGLCIDNKINTVIIPCGHQYHCASCIENYQPDSCPICRNVINQIIRTFLSGFSK